MNDSRFTSLSDSYSLASSISNTVLPFTDITLVGFNMTRNEALGVNRNGIGFDAGYYFALQERPGQLRFGADVQGLSSSMESWDDLSWQAMGDISLILTTTSIQGNAPFFDDIVPLSDWGKSSAEMAYVLAQKPVLFLVHSKDMIL